MLAPSEKVQSLRAARNLIADPAHWSCGGDSAAKMYCAIEADLFVRGFDVSHSGYWDHVSVELVQAALWLLDRFGDPADLEQDWWAVYRINDHHGHLATLQMYDRAIQIAEGRAE